MTGTLILHEEPDSSDPETLRDAFSLKVIPITFFLVRVKPNLFQPKFMFSFEAKLEMKKHQFNFELVSIVS